MGQFRASTKKSAIAKEIHSLGTRNSESTYHWQYGSSSQTRKTTSIRTVNLRGGSCNNCDLCFRLAITSSRDAPLAHCRMARLT